MAIKIARNTTKNIMSDSQQTLRQIYNSIDAAASGDSSKSRILISEAYITEVRKRDKKVRVSLLPDDQDIGWVRLYMQGLNNNWSFGVLPSVGNTCLILFPRGQMDSGICLSGGMSEGDELGSDIQSELDLHIHDSRGNKITMTGSGISVECDTLVVNGGIKGVARVGDLVTGPFGPMPIQTGSSNFLA